MFACFHFIVVLHKGPNKYLWPVTCMLYNWLSRKAPQSWALNTEGNGVSRVSDYSKVRVFLGSIACAFTPAALLSFRRASHCLCGGRTLDPSFRTLQFFCVGVIRSHGLGTRSHDLANRSHGHTTRSANSWISFTTNFNKSSCLLYTAGCPSFCGWHCFEYLLLSTCLVGYLDDLPLSWTVVILKEEKVYGKWIQQMVIGAFPRQTHVECAVHVSLTGPDMLSSWRTRCSV